MNVQTKRQSNHTKFQVLACDDHNFKKEDVESVGEFAQVCSHIVLECFDLARIGRPDILWSVNKLLRAVTKWTKAYDRRLARLISCIHQTLTTDSIVMWVIRLVCEWTEFLLLSNLDHVVTNASSSPFEAQLYISEENEAVIKMIIEGQKSHDETRVLKLR